MASSSYSDPGSPVEGLTSGEGGEWSLIQRLRDEEADSVTILCDNPDGPPNAAVECCGFWTGFAERRFEGDTVVAALRAAVAAKDEAARVGYPDMLAASPATHAGSVREMIAWLLERASEADADYAADVQDGADWPKPRNRYLDAADMLAALHPVTDSRTDRAE